VRIIVDLEDGGVGREDRAVGHSPGGRSSSRTDRYPLEDAAAAAYAKMAEGKCGKVASHRVQLSSSLKGAGQLTQL
jgi:hypothetical protein